jgi:hypothetical protein
MTALGRRLPVARAPLAQYLNGWMNFQGPKLQCKHKTLDFDIDRLSKGAHYELKGTLTTFDEV